MKLYNKIGYLRNEYVCDLTIELDSLANLIGSKYYKSFYHYILADEWCKNEKCLAIRVPGGTVGNILIDDNNVILEISIKTDYVIRTYPDNINELVQKFVGKTIKY